MKIYHEETYGDYYEVDAKTPDEGEQKLIKLIGDGKENSPETCQGSVTTAIIGKDDPMFQIMGAKIDALDENEKKFYLWHLLRYYYKRELHKEKEKYKNDSTTVNQINRLLENVEEIDTLLCYDIF